MRSDQEHTRSDRGGDQGSPRRHLTHAEFPDLAYEQQGHRELPLFVQAPNSFSRDGWSQAHRSAGVQTFIGGFSGGMRGVVAGSP